MAKTIANRGLLASTKLLVVHASWGSSWQSDRRENQERDEINGHDQSIYSDLGWPMVPIYARPT
jgi:hypothetical protein